MRYRAPEKKHLFLSFVVEDRDYINGIRLLEDNPKFNLEFLR